MDEKRYKFVVTKVPSYRIYAIKHLGSCGIRGLDEPTQIYDYLADHVPCVLFDGIDEKNATEIKEWFEKLEGECEIIESDNPHPMLLWPSIFKEYEYHWLWGCRQKKS